MSDHTSWFALSRTKTITAASSLLVLELSGEIDPPVAALMRAGLLEAAAALPARGVVLLDVTRVQFLCAAGVHAVRALVQNTADRGVVTRLVVAPDSAVRTVIQAAGLDRLVPVSATVDEAY